MTYSSKWINHDLVPSPPERRTWTWISMSLYWWSGAFNTNQWSSGSALISVGLTLSQAVGAAIIGHLISSGVALSMGRPGATYHIGYPVIARGVFGMYGAYFFVALRACVAIVWYGVQSFYGGKLLSVAIRCVFASHWQNIPNSLPESSGTNSRELLAFFLFWLIQFPFQFVHPTRIRHLFTVSSCVVPVACIGLFAWCVNYGGGLHANELGVTTQVSGGALGWAFMTGINSVMGTLSPLLVNQPDFTRYCKKPKDASWPQAASIFFSKTLMLFLGCGATAATQAKFGTAFWNQWDLLSAILDRFWGPAARAGCFFASIGFCLSILTTNFAANSMPFGSDVTGLLPEYITIKRGQVICSILGIAVVPWELLRSAQGFLTFLGSYSIFMAPLCAIIICDYFIIKRGNIHVLSLYDPTPGSLYYNIKGWNFIATGCWVTAMLLGLPGLIGAYDPQLVSEIAVHMYQTGWLITFVAGFVFYFVMAGFVFPPRVLPERSAGPFVEMRNSKGKLRYEALAATDGYLEGESIEDLHHSVSKINRVPVIEQKMSENSRQKEACVASKELIV
ncbi:NCS1 nucleoside transporter [Pseudovirgaria hyperparasitica]|uniref:NCS1 nucleoside transporter n=1 Tax=Pseudovirgaria hyperparasitica TaxID=470096 RepID=A0A6A6WF67_9PEZI|nr:NCS1 nucleoside transporter [Pseudovirgaria hyperparasitica]KAF2761468.1 NCS1 nucleoside transporter [Pseudovirgaria hyperparasitica]